MILWNDIHLFWSYYHILNVSILLIKGENLKVILLELEGGLLLH